MKRISILFAIILSFAFLLVEPKNTSAILRFLTLKNGFDLFAEVTAVFTEAYYKDFDDKKFAEKVLEGGISKFDRFSHYANPEQQKMEEENRKGRFHGIGVALGQKTENNNDFLVITSVMDNNPAMEAGIQSGDYLISISPDGDKNRAVLADDLSINEAANLIRGKENDKVYLKIRRGNKELEFIIPRKEVKINFLEGKSLKSGIGYVRLHQFGGNTTLNDFIVLVSSLQANGAQVLIFDLRNNPGGLIVYAVKVSNLFRINDSQLPIVTLKRKKEIETINGDAATAGKFKKMRVILLVNRASASASEIVAAYLKNYCNALVIGETTFGKGVGQTVFELDSGGQLTVTSFEYFVGEKKIKVHGIGVKPDIEMNNMEEDKTDKQLQRAIEEAEKILNKK